MIVRSTRTLPILSPGLSVCQRSNVPWLVFCLPLSLKRFLRIFRFGQSLTPNVRGILDSTSLWLQCRFCTPYIDIWPALIWSLHIMDLFFYGILNWEQRAAGFSRTSREWDQSRHHFKCRCSRFKGDLTTNGDLTCPCWLFSFPSDLERLQPPTMEGLAKKLVCQRYLLVTSNQSAEIAQNLIYFSLFYSFTNLLKEKALWEQGWICYCWYVMLP